MLVLAFIIAKGAIFTAGYQSKGVLIVVTSLICLVAGVSLLIVSFYYGQKENDELVSYGQARLARTRSGLPAYYEEDETTGP